MTVIEVISFNEENIFILFLNILPFESINSIFRIEDGRPVSIFSQNL